MNFPQRVSAEIRIKMFNEWQRLHESAAPELLMVSLFGAGLDAIVESGYTVVPPDEDKPRPVIVSPGKVKGHHAQLVHALKGEADNQITLSADHARAIAHLLDEVVAMLRSGS